jgi:TolB-like protein/DNA-binding winged helix-turn-helix (wHTH) protein/tetratricopeptide (TPR) repeat protein
MQIGEWLVDPSRDVIRCNSNEIKLEPRAMRLLCCLADPPGQVHTADELLSKVWPGLVVGQNSLYQAIAQLRKAFDDVGELPRYIETIPRKGYRLVATVSSPEVAVAASIAPAVLPASLPRWRRVAIAGMAMTALAAGWLAVNRWQKPPTAPKVSIPAIAVMPFLDLGTEADEKIFAEGLTEELTNTLVRVPGLKVTGRTSSQQAVAMASEPRRLGELLGVGYVLQGSVRSSAGRVRVSARVVSTVDGFQVWSNSYDRSRSGAIGVQTDIAQEVVGSLQIQLSPEAAGRIDRAPTTQLNAYDLYLLGRHQQLQRNRESLARAIEYHTQAIAIDPRFALAYAGLADAQMAGYSYANRSLADTAVLVEKSVAAALAIDPELAEAYAARAVLRIEQWDTDSGIADLQRAIAINPNVGEFYLRLGAAHEYAARPREALAAYDQVRGLDPLHTLMHVRRCLTLQSLARFQEASKSCERAFEIQPDIPNHRWAGGLNEFAQGKTSAAIDFYQQALARAPQRTDIRGELGLLYLDHGDPMQAEKQMAQAVAAAGPRAPQQRLVAARVLLAQGERAKLLAALRDAEFLASGDARLLAGAGFLAAAAGDKPLAERFRVATLAVAANPQEALQQGLYALRWGVCELCYLALLERLHGGDDAAAVHEKYMLAWLSDIERAGSTWHGLEYVRATLLAMRGNDVAALAALQRAVRTGWRSHWLTENDPAFTALRGRPEFRVLTNSAGSTARDTRSRNAQ